MGTAAALAGYQSVPSPPSGTGIPQTAASASPELGPFPFVYRAHGAGGAAGELVGAALKIAFRLQGHFLLA